jgi:hypothetical protein
MGKAWHADDGDRDNDANGFVDDIGGFSRFGGFVGSAGSVDRWVGGSVGLSFS